MRRCRLLVLPVILTKAIWAALMTTLLTSAALPRSRLTVRIVSVSGTAVTLQGPVVVPARRQPFLLAGEQRHRVGHHAAGVGRVDHRVDRSALGCRPRAEQPIFVLELELGSSGGVGLSMQDLHP